MNFFPQSFIGNKPPFGFPLNVSHNLSRGLIGLWLMNDRAGLKLLDYTYNKKVGSINNATWVPDGLLFNGSNAFVNFGNSNVFDFAGKDFTIWVRFYLNALGKNQDLLSRVKGTPDFNGWLLDLRNDNRFTFLPQGGVVGTQRCSEVLSANQWYNGAVTGTIIDGATTNYKLYLRGIECIYVGTTTEPILSDTQDLHMGNSPFGRWFDGRISNVLIYNSALADEEILELHWNSNAMFSYPAILGSLSFPLGAIINQFQGPNVGADLFNGALM